MEIRKKPLVFVYSFMAMSLFFFGLLFFVLSNNIGVAQAVPDKTYTQDWCALEVFAGVNDENSSHNYKGVWWRWIRKNDPVIDCSENSPLINGYRPDGINTDNFVTGNMEPSLRIYPRGWSGPTESGANNGNGQLAGIDQLDGNGETNHGFVTGWVATGNSN